MDKELNPGRIVKILRNGERFWLRNVRQMDGKFYGQVDNAVIEQPFCQGKIIEFGESEIIEEFVGQSDSQIQSIQKSYNILQSDLPSAEELRLHLGELTNREVRIARAAIIWANTRKGEK